MAPRQWTAQRFVRYSLRTLLAAMTVLGLTLPWLLSAIQRSVYVAVNCAPVRMPTGQVPGERNDAQRLLRPRLAFREWFTEHGFVFDRADSTNQSDIFQGATDPTRTLLATVHFDEGFAYLSMRQARDVYPWQEDESQLDDRALRLTNEAHAFAKRLFLMERGIRRIAGVQTGGWRLPTDAAATPGVGYAPPEPPPLGEPLPAWQQGFYPPKR